MEHVSYTRNEVPAIAARILAGLVPGKGATVLTLSGDLGSGKTTLVQALAQVLGIHETITSPTFVIQKRYALPHGPFANLIHIDAYRLEDPHELVVLGWDELLADPTNLIVLEWPERVEKILPASARRFELSWVDEDVRTITMPV